MAETDKNDEEYPLDKYELKMTINELDSLIDEYRFEEAAQIADRVDWRRVKSVRLLCKVSDLYKINHRYEDSKSVLELAHDKYPKGRRIIFSLCELELKLNNYVRALQLYNEYINVAPKDPDRFVLQYKIYKAQDVGLREKIAVLEELSRHDFKDKWSYELAKLYKEAGEEALCIAECDELVACYGAGKFVYRALELKKSLTQLTPQQQERYERLVARYNPKPDAEVDSKADLELKPESAPEESIAAKDEGAEVTGALNSGTEADEDFVPEPLQEPVSAEAIGEMEEEISEIPEDQGGIRVQPLVAEESIFSAENLQKRIAKGFRDLENYDPFLSQETDGQYKMVMQEDAKPEKQITGQLDLGEIMEEWEKVRRGFYENNGFDPEELPIRMQNNPAQETEFSHGRKKRITRSWDQDEVQRALQIRDDEDVGMNFDTHLFVTKESGEFPAEYEIEKPSKSAVRGDTAPMPFYMHSEESIRELSDALERIRLEGNRGNVIITGDEGVGRMSLVRELVQRYRRLNPNFVGQIVKTKGYKMTRQNLRNVLTRIPFGVLLIQRASSMSEEVTAALEEFLQQDCPVIIIFVDRKGVMDAFLNDHRKLRAMFDARIDIASLGLDTLIDYAREYAAKQNCEIDEFGISALQSRVRSMQTVDHSVTLEDMRDLVDEAVYYAGRKTLSSIVDSISRRRGSDSDKTVLRDKDFLHYN